MDGMTCMMAHFLHFLMTLYSNYLLRVSSALVVVAVNHFQLISGPLNTLQGLCPLHDGSKPKL